MPSEDIKAVKERLRENMAKEFRGLGHMRTSAASDDIRKGYDDAHVDALEAAPSPSAERESIKPGDTIALCLSQDAEAWVSALEKLLREMRDVANGVSGVNAQQQKIALSPGDEWHAPAITPGNAEG